jgi:lysophospholipase L1-like esterase
MKRMLLVAMLACTPRPSPALSAPQDSGVVPADTGLATTLHYVGRFDRRDPTAAVFSFPGSAVFARFSGDGIDADLETNGNDFFTVVLDNGAPKTIRPPAGRGKRTLASGLSGGTRDIALYKATESAVGTATFRGFGVSAGALVPSPFPFAHRIEIVGDSISCGYGVRGTSGGCPFTPDTESEWDAWGAIAARSLNAAHTTIAYSGRGVVRNSNGTRSGTMATLYERTLAEHADPRWDFSSFTPEIVVINLGTNDYAQGDPGPTFALGYHALLQMIRQHYPSASIVCALGTMLTPAELASARLYVKEAMTRMNDARISFLEIAPSPSEGLGCGEHPNARTQQRMGMALATHIRETMKW